ncbi:MAG: hypothetical protein Q4Q17_04300 [Tissierellia bacterium]|nr:hypothetical protein [Tissierellia bacterium]
MAYNYNLTKPKTPPKKYLSFSQLTLWMVCATAGYLFAKVFLEPYILYSLIREGSATFPDFYTLTGFQPGFLGVLYKFLIYFGRTALPIAVFLSIHFLRIGGKKVLASFFLFALASEILSNWMMGRSLFDFIQFTCITPMFLGLLATAAWDKCKPWPWARALVAIALLSLCFVMDSPIAFMVGFFYLFHLYFEPNYGVQSIFTGILSILCTTMLLGAVGMYFYDPKKETPRNFFDAIGSGFLLFTLLLHLLSIYLFS